MSKANDHTFFCNTDCKYFPCHAGADPEQFNCLFCYCPLYTLGDQCGGNFRRTPSGIKDCSDCLIPHSINGYQWVTERCGKIVEAVRTNLIEEKERAE